MAWVHLVCKNPIFQEKVHDFRKINNIPKKASSDMNYVEVVKQNATFDSENWLAILKTHKSIKKSVKFIFFSLMEIGYILAKFLPVEK